MAADRVPSRGRSPTIYPELQHVRLAAPGRHLQTEPLHGAITRIPEECITVAWNGRVIVIGKPTPLAFQASGRRFESCRGRQQNSRLDRDLRLNGAATIDARQREQAWTKANARHMRGTAVRRLFR
jgi:hypothetical protein